MIKKTSYKLYDLLRRYLLATVLFVTLISIIGFSWITYFSIKNDRNFLNQQINLLLSQVLVPSLEISDTIEIKRILNLASKNHHFIAIVDKDADILVANYININNVQNTLKSLSPKNCDEVKQGTININNQYYYVSCYPLSSSNKPGRFLGLMLNFSSYSILPFSTDILVYTAILFFVSMLLILIILRNVINKHLVQPISELEKDILEKISNPLDATYDEKQKTSSSEEIITIRDSFYQLIQHLQQEYTKSIEVQKESALYQLSRQLAHDIRSPLAALDMILQDISQMSEEKRIITRNAIYRIRDIANNLVYQHCEEEYNHKSPLACLLISIIDSLISEKRIQYRSKLNMQIEFIPGNESYGLFANINLAEFKRVLSNLINNAVEALGEEGQVTITLEKNGQLALIKIKDNGPGIPQFVLKNLGARGNTYGKKGGAGLGLSHAIENLKQWQGEIKIESSANSGTCISISLPLTKPPTWFLQSLKMLPGSHIIILDDDSTIHQIWNENFEKLKLSSYGIAWYHFSNKNALAEWLALNQANKKSLLVLCDYEIIGNQENGLDIIESLDIAPYSILVTSRYEQPEIQTRCNQLNISLLPKSLAMLVPIEITYNNQEKLDLILLDDDDLIRGMWELSAKMKNKKIKTFSQLNNFENYLLHVDKDTPIYLDYSLSENLTGIEVAKKLHYLGYTQLYLTTGHIGNIYFTIPKYIKAVVSKDFPYTLK